MRVCFSERLTRCSKDENLLTWV
ncbi:hypothetical protein F01_470002 [Burkholderia cenocepacia]|nr:hypothetical protein F01_470002 [Burkholderia cenocepacia]